MDSNHRTLPCQKGGHGTNGLCLHCFSVLARLHNGAHAGAINPTREPEQRGRNCAGADLAVCRRSTTQQHRCYDAPIIQDEVPMRRPGLMAYLAMLAAVTIALASCGSNSNSNSTENPADLATAGTCFVVVTNPSPGGGSASLSFSVTQEPITGTWIATTTSAVTGYVYAGNAVLTQSGSSITGTWTCTTSTSSSGCITEASETIPPVRR